MTHQRSSVRIVYSSLDVKAWMQEMPSVTVGRPEQCPCCGAAGSPLGCRVQLHGHGTRSRQVRGPLRPYDEPQEVQIRTRRYLCRQCGAVVQVVPRGVLRCRLFSANAIALALALWALYKLPAAEVRRRVSPWRKLGATAASGWASLRRWVSQGSQLFSWVRPSPQTWKARHCAERIATTLASNAPGNTDELLACAFVGAAQPS